MSDNPEHEHEDERFSGFTLSEIKKNFKSLAAEIETGGRSLEELVNTVEQKPNEKVEKIPYYRGYDPTVTDFLARASTHEQCEEIIAYCLDKGEITQKEAKKLRNRLKKGGPRAFGTRLPGYYDKKL